MQNWTAMRRSDFDRKEPLTLFDLADIIGPVPVVSPDKYGTPDLFTAEGENQ